MADARAGSAADAGRGGPPDTPRWVKVAALLAGLLILLFLVLQFAGLGGEHGPGMHDSSGRSPASGATALPAVEE